VYVNVDVQREADELFCVKLSDPSANAYLGDAQGVGVVDTNDD
jgi:hypothetical protein